MFCNKFFQSVIHWFLPPICILCGAAAHRSRDLCIGCEADLPWVTSGCYQCGQPIIGQPRGICGACFRDPPPYDRLFALCYYQFPLLHIMTGLKFHRQLGYAQVLGELLAERLEKYYEIHAGMPDVLVPVPLHASRLRERGYNQALELARPITKKLNIPVDIRSCERIRSTDHQMHVPAAHRAANVSHAFRISPLFQAKHVALIDDVVTTGHTVGELSRALRTRGVQRIDIICCARTILTK
jgi:ComF family protein